jgi:DNA-binding NtrC family response regulator
MRGPGQSVLVVDDDPSLRMLVRVNLELEGFVVREAGTVDDARAEVDAARPAVVFLDMHLGKTSSSSLLDELRADGIPVVLVTGTADLEELRGRAEAVLPKPFLPDDLVSAAHRFAVG